MAKSAFGEEQDPDSCTYTNLSMIAIKAAEIPSGDDVARELKFLTRRAEVA